jgi:hypothetical protein
MLWEQKKLSPSKIAAITFLRMLSVIAKTAKDNHMANEGGLTIVARFSTL